jgi:hypothetical protein
MNLLELWTTKNLNVISFKVGLLFKVKIRTLSAAAIFKGQIVIMMQMIGTKY